MADYYDTLGVSRSASQDEIKKAFRKLAHRYHPDKEGGDEKKFKQINEAYQVLGNTDKRAKYDRFGSAAFGQGGPGGAGGFNWQDFSGQGGFSGGFGFEDLGEMFGDMFGFGGRGQGKRSNQGADLRVDMSLNFKEAIFGVTKKVRLNKAAKCSHCQGSGAEPGTKVEACGTCKGSGQVTRVQRTILGSFQTASVCPDCRGRGKKAEKKCPKCAGVGIVSDTVGTEVDIPAGTDDGQRIRVPGEGEAGPLGGPSGDLIIVVRVGKSREFQRRGYDIYSKLGISFPLAVLGGKIKVKTVDDPVKLKVPAGTSSGTVFKLRGKGVPRGGSRGDHYLEVFVKVPDKLGKKQKDLVKKLADGGLAKDNFWDGAWGNKTR